MKLSEKLNKKKTSEEVIFHKLKKLMNTKDSFKEFRLLIALKMILLERNKISKSRNIKLKMIIRRRKVSRQILTIKEK